MSEARSIIDCGHPPSPHGEHTTGDCVVREEGQPERRICWDCAHQREVKQMLTAKRHFAYITEENGHWIVSNWPGRKLGDVLNKHEVRNWMVERGYMTSHWHYVRVRDVNGHIWFGYTGGPGLYVRLRKPRQCAECHAALKGRHPWLHPDDITQSEFCSRRCVERVVERSNA